QIVLADKEVQFHLGHDDTALENLMRRLQSSRGTSSVGQEAKGGQERDYSFSSGLTLTEEDAQGSTTTFKGLYRSGSEEGGVSHLSDTAAAAAAASMYHPRDSRNGGDGGGGGGGGGIASLSKPALPPRPQRLGKFLRQACVVMETLCEENLLNQGAGGGRRGGGGKPNDPGENSDDDDDDDERFSSMFPKKETAGFGWQEVGSQAEATGKKSGALVGGSSDAATEPTVVNGGGEGKSDNANDGSVKPRDFGLSSLLDGVDVVGVAFSRVKRSMLVTAHARTDWQRAHKSGSGSGSAAGLGEARRDELGPLLEGCGVVCVWNAENVTGAPSSVLYGEGLFSCLCLALHQPHVVVVGTAEGCLLLWDLREPIWSGRKEEARELGLLCGLRPPTYTTAGGGGGGGGDTGTPDPGHGHTSAVVSVVPIPVPEGGVDAGGGMGGMMSLGETNSFQVASLDDRGTVSIWLATEVKLADEGGSRTDLGLSPGGRIRLTLSKSLRPGNNIGGHLGGAGASLMPTPPAIPSIVSSAASTSAAGGGGLTSPPPAGVNASVARALAFSLDDPNRFLVADSADRIAHASRLGDPPPPRAYRVPLRCAWKGLEAASGRGAGEGGRGAMGGVTCLSFSPFFRRYFLAGCGDGSVRLYKDDCAVPLAVWEHISEFTPTAVAAAPTAAADNNNNGGGCCWPAGISSVAWSEHRAAVFFVLDTLGTLHAFNVLKDESHPVASEPSPAAVLGVLHPAEKGDKRGGRRGSTLPQGPPKLPGLALSSETLATGSRPRVAVSIGSRVFTRRLSGRVFRPRKNGDKVMSRGQGGMGGGGATERERMEEWLKTVLWG
ncbi:unnamed protein product, partial [Laminaria digitata]